MLARLASQSLLVSLYVKSCVRHWSNGQIIYWKTTSISKTNSNNYCWTLVLFKMWLTMIPRDIGPLLYASLVNNAATSRKPYEIEIRQSYYIGHIDNRITMSHPVSSVVVFQRPRLTTSPNFQRGLCNS